nr:MAG TPA: hypothetical protein [Caudoviricetes sp.]
MAYTNERVLIWTLKTLIVPFWKIKHLPKQVLFLLPESNKNVNQK